jgi:hypothetical protein
MHMSSQSAEQYLALHKLAFDALDHATHAGQVEASSRQYTRDEKIYGVLDRYSKEYWDQQLDYQSGRWCGECAWGVTEDPPCCY